MLRKPRRVTAGVYGSRSMRPTQPRNPIWTTGRRTRVPARRLTRRPMLLFVMVRLRQLSRGASPAGQSQNQSRAGLLVRESAMRRLYYRDGYGRWATRRPRRMMRTQGTSASCSCGPRILLTARSRDVTGSLGPPMPRHISLRVLRPSRARARRIPGRPLGEAEGRRNAGAIRPVVEVCLD